MQARAPIDTALEIGERMSAHERQFDLARLAIAAAVARKKDLDVRDLITADNRMSRQVKAAVAQSGLADGGLSGAFSAAAPAFVSSLSSAGALELVMQNAKKVPSPTFVSVASSIGGGLVPEGTEVFEGQAKPVTRLRLVPGSLNRYKATSTVVFSDLAIEFADPGAVDFVHSELQAAVLLASDDIFLTALLNGVASMPTTGSVQSDMYSLLTATGFGSTSRRVLVMARDVSDQIDAIPISRLPRALLPEKVGLPRVVSGAAPAGSLILIDASQLVMLDEGLGLSEARHASIEMDDDPDGSAASPPVPAQLVSLWQTNSVAYRTERRWRLYKANPEACAWVSGIGWEGVGSPAPSSP